MHYGLLERFSVDLSQLDRAQLLVCMLDWLEALKLAIDASALDAGFHTSGEGGVFHWYN